MSPRSDEVDPKAWGSRARNTEDRAEFSKRGRIIRSLPPRFFLPFLCLSSMIFPVMPGAKPRFIPFVCVGSEAGSPSVSGRFSRSALLTTRDFALIILFLLHFFVSSTMFLLRLAAAAWGSFNKRAKRRPTRQPGWQPEFNYFVSRVRDGRACSFNCLFVPGSLSARAARFYLFSSTMRHARPLWNFRHPAIDENDPLATLHVLHVFSTFFPPFQPFAFFLHLFFTPRFFCAASGCSAPFEIISVSRCCSPVSILRSSCRRHSRPLVRAANGADRETYRRFFSVFLSPFFSRASASSV